MKISSNLIFFSVLLSFTFVSSVSGQLQIASVNNLADAIRYLLQFGYIRDIKEVISLLNPTANIGFANPADPARSALRIAFAKFQQYAKLPQTGEFDAATKAKMNTGRCGNKDILPDVPAAAGELLGSLLKRKKRYVISGFKWKNLELTYRFTSFSKTDFQSTIIERDVARAFEYWSNETNLQFIRNDDIKDVDIDLRFATGAHGDIEAFDGRGITLAHAYPPGPEIGGDVHFDDDEDWTSQVLSGTNFFHVAVHEIGHALGLRHSEIEEAVMYAFTKGYDPDFKLHEDDVQGVQSIYGEKGKLPVDEEEGTTPRSVTDDSVSVTPETEKPPIAGSGSQRDLCRDSQLDDITALKNGDIYAFKGAHAFRVFADGKGVDRKRSERIDYLFRGLEYPIDAAVTLKDGKTYFFKGGHYWRYDEKGKLDGKFPQKISSAFPGIPNNLDTAFIWSGDQQLYFFKGSQYWAFIPDESPKVPTNFPLPISQWLENQPKDIDAAFQVPDGPTYFFKNDSYWLFDDENFEVATADPIYPRSSRVFWFGCTKFRPDIKDLRQGWIKRTVNKIVETVKTVVDYKIDKLKGFSSRLRQSLPIFRETP